MTRDTFLEHAQTLAARVRPATVHERSTPMETTYDEVQITRDWISALRSGRYTQGRGKLRTSRGNHMEGQADYCCYGVLLEVLLQHDITEDTEGRSIDKALHSDYYPSNEVLGMVSINSHFDFKNARTGLGNGLAGHNDDRGFHRASFSEIADMLETQHLPTLR